VLDLGAMPLTTEYRAIGDRTPEPRFPLEMAFCPDCSLVQITETLPPERLFHHDYPYYSSFSDALLQHSRENALEIIKSRKLGAGNLVVELASNDGYLLKNFVEHGIPVLGIDPAGGPAEAARKIGVRTVCAFFGRQFADNLRAEGHAADVIIGNNVLAHVADTNGFVAGIRRLLKDDGVVAIEAPYVRDMIDQGQLDTAYHEHLCYFSATAIDALFRRHGLYLNDVRWLPIHGGSLRYYAEIRANPSVAVRQLLVEEKRRGIDRADYYRDFAERVRGFRGKLRELIGRLKLEGQRIAAYGAASKGAILLNFVGLDVKTIDFAVDKNPHKQGHCIPGTGIPINAPARLMEARPDYVLILPWNFRDEILEQQAAFRKAGGRFIIPIPELKIV